MITIDEAKEMLSMYLEAEKNILRGQSYRIGKQELTRANLTEVVKNREKWQKIVNDLENPLGSRPKIKRIVIRDL